MFEEVYQLNRMGFQSAFHRGMECYFLQWLYVLIGAIPFSPLFIAVWNVTRRGRCGHVQHQTSFQSAFHRGMECYFSAHNVPSISQNTFSPLFIAVWNVTTRHRYTTIPVPEAFSPLFIAVWNVTVKMLDGWNVTLSLSVRFSSRYGMLPRFRRVLRGTPNLSVRFSSRYGMLPTLFRKTAIGQTQQESTFVRHYCHHCIYSLLCQWKSIYVRRVESSSVLRAFLPGFSQMC